MVSKHFLEKWQFEEFLEEGGFSKKLSTILSTFFRSTIIIKKDFRSYLKSDIKKGLVDQQRISLSINKVQE